MAIYELALMGAPSTTQINEINHLVTDAIAPFGLKLGVEVGWTLPSSSFTPSDATTSAVAFFGAPGVSDAGLPTLLQRKIPILPIASRRGTISNDMPTCLLPFNCMAYAEDGALRIATALLECATLLPRQRRVFISYRRPEAREAALQLFDALAARVFDVFLDTHGIAPADDFQEVLWHRLCDSDVLIMLDTPNYFNSRWAESEFGRALAKNIAVLRVGWPGVIASPRAATATQLALVVPDEIDVAKNQLTKQGIERICDGVEALRSKSHAVRHLNLVSGIERAIQDVGGAYLGVGAKKGIHVRLPDNKEIVVFPTSGVPTSIDLHEAKDRSPAGEVAVVYDAVGLRQRWQGHLDWLGQNISTVRWIKAHEAAWTFGGWNAR